MWTETELVTNNWGIFQSHKKRLNLNELLQISKNKALRDFYQCSIDRKDIENQEKMSALDCWKVVKKHECSTFRCS